MNDAALSREFLLLRRLAGVAALWLAIGTHVPLAWAQALESPVSQAAAPVYRRPAALLEERVTDLLARMTMAEKLAQLHSGLLTTHRTASRIEALQRGAVNQTRLGIPILFFDAVDNGFRGHADRRVTAFPQAIALASSWDPGLVQEVYGIHARDLRARGGGLLLGPALDVSRDPRHGRVELSFGEDPYFVAEMGVAAVTGLQGPGVAGSLPPGKVLAAVQHLAGPGPSDEGAGPVPVSERELREVYLPPFEAVVKRTGIQAIAASRNEIDGVPSHASKWLLRDILRQEWQFGGAVLADQGGVNELQSLHHVATSVADASRLALEAGIDVDMSDGHAHRKLTNAVREGRVSSARIDEAVSRILRLKFRAGLFEQPFAEHLAAGTLHRRSSSRTALIAAQRSVILLKNDGALPLALAATGERQPKIAVFSKMAVMEGIRSRVRGRAEVAFMKDLRVARTADHIVVVIGEHGQTGRDQEQRLLDSLRTLGKPIVIVLVSGRPHAGVKIAEQANALVAAWGLGEQGGRAIADVLFGDINPGGKLPVTLPRSVGQSPLFYNVKPSAQRGYLFDTTEALYPFGWGLSYSAFELSPPRLSAASIGLDGSVEVSVDVRNSSQRAGDETIQLYIRDKLSSVTRPVKELKGFQRVSLAPGEQRSVTFLLNSHSLAMWDDSMRRVVEPGEFDIMTGPNSIQLQSAKLTVLGEVQK